MSPFTAGRSFASSTELISIYNASVARPSSDATCDGKRRQPAFGDHAQYHGIGQVIPDDLAIDLVLQVTLVTAIAKYSLEDLNVRVLGVWVTLHRKPRQSSLLFHLNATLQSPSGGHQATCWLTAIFF